MAKYLLYSPDMGHTLDLHMGEPISDENLNQTLEYYKRLFDTMDKIEVYRLVSTEVKGEWISYPEVDEKDKYVEGESEAKAYAEGWRPHNPMTHSLPDGVGEDDPVEVRLQCGEIQVNLARRFKWGQCYSMANEIVSYRKLS